jgi:hypothetical protein
MTSRSRSVVKQKETGLLSIIKKPKYFHMQSLYIQGVSGGIVNILGGGSMDYSE